MNSSHHPLRESFDFERALGMTKEQGYYFEDDALSDEFRRNLRSEVDNVALENGDHTEHAINAGKPNEVRQLHERFYTEFGNPLTPVANMVIAGLAQQIEQAKQFPELRGWRLSEIGYQRYHEAGFIGIHKDRSSDRMLSITFTISGSAPVELYRTLGDPVDYSPDNVEKIDGFVTTPGSIMMLRAPEFGSGEQVPHKVLQPLIAPRAILNLRMRPTILEQPSHPKWQS